MNLSVFKACDKVHACQNPTLQLLVIKILEHGKQVIVETAQTKTKLILVHESDRYVLRKYNIRGEVAGRVLNNWTIQGEAPWITSGTKS